MFKLSKDDHEAKFMYLCHNPVLVTISESTKYFINTIFHALFKLYHQKIVVNTMGSILIYNYEDKFHHECHEISLNRKSNHV